jgi:sugar lactone lactonase YvrE
MMLFWSSLFFDINSTFIYMYTGYNNISGSALNEVSTPNSVYYDYLYSNSLYVTDSGNNRILKFPPGSTGGTFGTVVAGNGVSGSGSNQLSNPRSVVVDSKGTVYVTDGGKRKIKKDTTNVNKNFVPFSFIS